MLKIHILWEGHKHLAKPSNSIWRYLVSSKQFVRFFQMFGAFSEYMNFTINPITFNQIFKNVLDYDYKNQRKISWKS